MPAEAGRAPEDDAQPRASEPEPPLAEPLALDDAAAYELLGRYGLQPLLPLAKFEYQLLELIAGLEQRIRALQ